MYTKHTAHKLKDIACYLPHTMWVMDASGARELLHSSMLCKHFSKLSRNSWTGAIVFTTLCFVLGCYTEQEAKKKRKCLHYFFHQANSACNKKNIFPQKNVTHLRWFKALFVSFLHVCIFLNEQPKCQGTN